MHGLSRCMDEHWDSDDVVVLTIDMKNAFNLVSQQALLDECALFFALVLHKVVLFGPSI